jgi:hypothetical protein
MSETGRYVYAVCRGLDPSAVLGSHGLDGQPLEVVEHRGLAAVISTVDLAEYGEEGLRQNLENLQWLENAARGHDAAIQAVAALAPTAPLRLATICRDDDGVRDRLDEWHDALHRALDRIEGRSEWSVKVLTNPRAAQPVGADSAGAAGSGPVSGADYLRRKKAEADHRLNDDARAADVALTVHETLAAAAVANRRLPAQDPRLTGRAGTMTLNGAYLVDNDAAEQFAGHVDELAARFPDVVIDRAGPWPPYSFATLEQP